MAQPARKGRPPNLARPKDEDLPQGWMKKSKFAELLKCPPSRVTEWISRKIIAGDGLHDGDIVPRRAVQQLAAAGCFASAPTADVSPDEILSTMLGGSVPPSEISGFVEAVLAGRFAHIGLAEQIKENALALKHLLDGRQKAGNLVERETAEAVLFETSRAARDAWLNWPVRVGPLLAADLGLDAQKVTEALIPYVQQQLESLGEPDADFTDQRD